MLTPCSSCRRHVNARDALCPFCGAAIAHVESTSEFPRASRAQLFAFAAAAAIAGCDNKKAEPPPVTNVATESSTSAAPSASDEAAGLGALGHGDASLGAAYGGAPSPASSLNVTTGAVKGADVAALDATSIIARTRPRFRACYQRQLAANPALSPANATLAIDVASDGSVTSAKVVEPGFDSTLASCLVTVARSLQFKSTGKASALTVPLAFSKAD